MYKSSLRHIHDPVLSSLRMKCIRLLYCLYLCSPTPTTTRPHTCAYVTRMKDNVSRSFEPRHVIPDTRISSGQCPRCDVNVTLGSRDFQSHTKKRALRHIHVNNIQLFHWNKAVFPMWLPFGWTQRICVTIERRVLRLHWLQQMSNRVQYAGGERFHQMYIV
jgi:hypothetical protein